MTRLPLRLSAHVAVPVCMLLAVLFLLAALSGCATLEKNVDFTALAVKQTVQRAVIEKGDRSTWSERAASVRATAAKAKGWLEGKSVSLDDVEVMMKARIAELDLAPSDRAIAAEFVPAVAKTMAEQATVVDRTVPLASEQLYKVGVVFGWIEDAASWY